MEIRWRFLDAPNPRRILLCYRIKGEVFARDPYDEHANGELIISDYQDGQIVTQLEIGHSYSFTAFVKQTQPANPETLTTKDNYVQFRLRIPKPEEDNALKAWTEHFNTRKEVPQPENDPEVVKFNKIMKDAMAGVPFEAAFMKGKKDAIDAVRSSEDFKVLTRKEQDEIINRVKGRFEAAAQRLFEATSDFY